MYWIIYPDTRQVSESTLRGWLADDISDGDIIFDGDPKTADIEMVMELLSDTGKVTFAARNADEAILNSRREAECLEREIEYGFQD
jgi:hypothetical protein